ncbi:MAG: ABC transporter substrate-binding protein [Pyrinomonadaceae bacterium]
MRKILISFVLAALALSLACRRNATSSDTVTIALPDKFTTLDTLTSTGSDAAAERLRTMIFNTLVRKNENFEYVGELAQEIQTSADNKTITFVLHDNVKFHNGKPFTSADVKYTFDELFKSGGYKSGAFFDTVPAASKPTAPPAAAASSTPANGAAKPAESPAATRVAHIESITTPDARTVVFVVSRPALKNQLLSNLVAIPIIAEGTAAQQKEQPVGTGPYKFTSFDQSQNIVELAANGDYWEGAPKVAKIRVKTVTDANSLAAELQTGGVDIAPNPSNLPPDSIKSLTSNPDLKLEQSDGSNIQYLVFNTQSAPLDKVKIRQAIAYGVDRQKIINELLSGQAKAADSILPAQSWAYAPGRTYSYDPAKARQLLAEAGYKGEPIKFKYGSGNAMVNQYSQAIQSSLAAVGLNVQIETLEVNTIRQQLAQGDFQMYTGVWIGGNQDPIFLRDLFSSSRIPGGAVSCCNRSRYVNAQVDKLVDEAINAADREQAKALYGQVWQIVSEEVPLLPLWYPNNIVIANKRVGNIKIGPSGDWSFVKDMTLTN